MRTVQEHNHKPIHIWTDEVEQSAMQQLRNLAQMGFIHERGIAVMPDVHCGIGATVGSVIPTVGAIIPAAVGVDIGCGMNAVRLNIKAYQLPHSLTALRSSIESRVPLGPGARRLAKHDMPKAMGDRLTDLSKRHPKAFAKGSGASVAEQQIGSLGGGNHFIELCIDEDSNVWIMLHSGSRGIGNKIGSYFIGRARALADERGIRLPDRDLGYFEEGTEEFVDYTTAVSWAQEYAWLNRQKMMAEVLRCVAGAFSFTVEATDEAINCHHNYVALEEHFGSKVYVTRKGAIRARKDDLGIIPGSMGQRSFIVRGRGSDDSYHSCSHGAGRVMSRSKAKQTITLAQLQEQTAGVECRKDSGVLDEAPSAYKNLDEVMAQQTDLVDVVHTLKAVMCIKGN